MSNQLTLEPPVDPVPEPGPPEPRRGRRVHLVGALAGVLVAAVVGGLVLWSHRSSAGTKSNKNAAAVAWGRPPVSATGLAERSGVKITRLTITGDGGLVDLRYQVVDANKANALHDKQTPTALVDEQSGLVVNQLFMDHAHTGPHKVGETYYLVFNNPGNWVHHGSKVTVLLGNAQVEHVVVR